MAGWYKDKEMFYFHLVVASHAMQVPSPSHNAEYQNRDGVVSGFAWVLFSTLELSYTTLSTFARENNGL